jgi:hypothetical protein
MLFILAAAAAAGWLALWAVLAGRTSPGTAPGTAQAQGEVPPRPAGSEPPAVVSLLAGRLAAVGYPATLLDLAARGWFGLEPRADGRVMCVLGKHLPGGELTAYEHRAYTQLVTRACGRPDVPAEALSDGFAGTPTGSDGTMKSGRDAFMEAFNRDVIDDSRRRGLTCPRLSEAAGCLLWLAALVPAIALGLALRADRSYAYWVPVAGFVTLCALTGVAVKGEKLTPAGRAALRAWRASCTVPAASVSADAGPAAAGYDVACPGGGATAATRMPAGWPRREIAYAAALGRARAAVKLFSPANGKPAKAIWSGYSEQWRQITIGDPQPRSWIQAGGTGLAILACVLAALLPPTLATAVIAHGELRAAAFGVLASDVLIAACLLAKDAAVPGFAEFDGLVVEAWTEDESGENSSTTHWCLAIDDGVRDQAWAFSVTAEQYRTYTAGSLVHAQVDPRRNRLLVIRS